MDRFGSSPSSLQPVVRVVGLNWASRTAPWVTLSGTLDMLLGFGLDALLHRLDPTLAAREGIFTLANPGHALFAAGLALVVASGVLFLLGQLGATASWLRRAGLVVLLGDLLALSLVSCGLASSTEGSVLAAHAHGPTGAAAGTPTASAHVQQSGDPSAPTTPEQRAAADH